MGIVIKNKTKSIDMGVFGFNRLRTTIAYLCNDEIGDHYDHCTDGLFLSPAAKEEFYKNYDSKTYALDEKYNYQYDTILYFLYQSDVDGKLSYKDCRELYKLIKDYDDDIIYGYTGRPDAARFKDFKEIVEDCAKNRRTLYWY